MHRCLKRNEMLYHSKGREQDEDDEKKREEPSTKMAQIEYAPNVSRPIVRNACIRNIFLKTPEKPTSKKKTLTWKIHKPLNIWTEKRRTTTKESNNFLTSGVQCGAKHKSCAKYTP